MQYCHKTNFSMYQALMLHRKQKHNCATKITFSSDVNQGSSCHIVRRYHPIGKWSPLCDESTKHYPLPRASSSLGGHFTPSPPPLPVSGSIPLSRYQTDALCDLSAQPSKISHTKRQFDTGRFVSPSVIWSYDQLISTLMSSFHHNVSQVRYFRFFKSQFVFLGSSSHSSFHRYLTGCRIRALSD